MSISRDQFEDYLDLAATLPADIIEAALQLIHLNGIETEAEAIAVIGTLVAITASLN